MKRQQITPSAILEICLPDGYYCYAQILRTKDIAFGDFKSNNKITDFTVLEKANVLFIVGVYNDIITRGEWIKVGKMQTRKNLLNLRDKYIYHKFDKLQFELYNPQTGEIVPSTKEVCRGRECCAVWDKHHVEDRIMNHYKGERCKWLKQDYELFGAEPNYDYLNN